MNLFRTSLFLLAALLLIAPASAATPQLSTWANRTTVDSDGDTVADLFDNAPGFFDPSQVDADMDQIGDVIDPTPSNSNPALGDPGLGMLGPYTIAGGSSVALDYIMNAATPPGAWGHIDLDLGGDSVYDATYFGPLTTAGYNQIVIPAGMFELPGLYSQTVNGSYTVFAKAYGPGMQSQNVTITGVNVVPEPATLLLALGAMLAIMSACHRAR
jgi:hypothetical protein